MNRLINAITFLILLFVFILFFGGCFLVSPIVIKPITPTELEHKIEKLERKNQDMQREIEQLKREFYHLKQVGDK